MNQDPIEVRVVSVRDVARETRLYELARPDGAPLPAGEPGAHIGVHLPNGIMRQYSLVHANTRPTSYVIGVKRGAEGHGGSRWIHDELREGALLSIDAPRNNFPLVLGAPHSVLFAGGIGITPIWSMVELLQALGRDWQLYYACRSRPDAAFRGELERLGRTHFHFDDEAGGFLDIAGAVAKAPPDAHLYCCGPAAMLAAFEAATASRPRAQVHVEYFTAKEAAALEGGFTVECAQSRKQFFIPPGRKILHVLREGGVQVSSSCEEGICGACEVSVLAGVPDHRDAILTEAERQENKTMFVCCSGARTGKLVLDI
jgi:ferredoxin-NADP reductase